MYETLQSIVDQLEFCEYQTEDGQHCLEMNAAFVALKERAAAEAVEQTGTSPNSRSDGMSTRRTVRQTL